MFCKVLEVSRSGYYAWLKRRVSLRQQETDRLKKLITLSFKQSKQSYGYRRIYKDLKEQGERCSKHRIYRLMQCLGLKPKVKRRFRVTTDSNHTKPISPNLINRDFNAEKPNERWTSDITYVSTREGWLYLAVVMDLFSRRIVGWSLSRRLKESLVIEALKMALCQRKLNSGLILHSDRGSQYASKGYQQLLKRYRINGSMSRAGNCWDNAVTESFFRSLKVECLHQEKLQTREEAKSIIFNYIEVFYNRQRRHSSIGYRSPIDFEKAMGVT